MHPYSQGWQDLSTSARPNLLGTIGRPNLALTIRQHHPDKWKQPRGGRSPCGSRTQGPQILPSPPLRRRTQEGTQSLWFCNNSQYEELGGHACWIPLSLRLHGTWTLPLNPEVMYPQGPVILLHPNKIHVKIYKLLLKGPMAFQEHLLDPRCHLIWRWCHSCSWPPGTGAAPTPPWSSSQPLPRPCWGLASSWPRRGPCRRCRGWGKVAPGSCTPALRLDRPCTGQASAQPPAVPALQSMTELTTHCHTD